MTVGNLVSWSMPPLSFALLSHQTIYADALLQHTLLESAAFKKDYILAATNESDTISELNIGNFCSFSGYLYTM